MEAHIAGEAAAPGLDVGGMLSSVINGGTILTIIVGMVKNKMIG